MIVRQTAIDRTARFETFVAWFYLDTASKVTVGYGHMLANDTAATSVAMKEGNQAATSKAKKDAWALISGKPAGHIADYYKPFTTIRLGEPDARKLLEDDLGNAAADVLKRFSSLDDYPEDAQDALLDMMFNIGLTNFNATKWPKLFKAVEDENWTEAAKQCNRPAVPASRNDEIRKLFEKAGSVLKSEGLSAGFRQVETIATDAISRIAGLLKGEGGTLALFPNGVTKVRLSLSAGPASIEVEISGPPSVDS